MAQNINTVTISDTLTDEDYIIGSVDNKLRRVPTSFFANAVDSRIGELENDTAVLEARMDTFTALEDGSTTGDAEIQDIRVGADGTTYDTAGDAVRKQVTNLQNNIINSQKLYTTSNLDIETISEHETGARLIRANKFDNCLLYGIDVYSQSVSYLEYGIMNYGSSMEKMGEITTKIGHNIILFDEPIECNESRSIYIYGTSSVVYANSTNGMGMFQYANDEWKTFDEWEIAYRGIYFPGMLEFEETRLTDLKYGEIIVPSEIHIANNTECNLWWSNIANVEEYDKSVYFETVCDIGRNGERGFSIGYNETLTAGEYPLRIVCRNTKTREILSDKNTILKVFDNTSNDTTKNILMIGDSRTWQSFGGTNGTTAFSNFEKGDNKTISTELLYLTNANNGTKLNMIGSYVSPNNSKVKNLADNGTTYSWALGEIQSAGGIQAYCESNGLSNGDELDIVTIMYGINDIEDWDNNVIDQYSYSKKKIDSIITDAKTLINEILSVYIDCKIILVIEPTTCANQDGFGFWIGETTARNSHNEIELAQKYLRQRMIETFDYGCYNSNVILSSAGMWCDRLYGFPYLIQPMSRRSSAKTKELFQDCVHPFDDGYKQIADGIFSTIKSLE